MQAVGRRTLVITAVGSGVGRTLLQSLRDRRPPLRIVGLGSHAQAPELYACDAAWCVPPTADGAAHRRALVELMDAERADLVVPGRDDDVLALAELGEARPALADRLLVGSVAGARVLVDKRESAAFAARHGLPFAPTVDAGAAGAGAAARAMLHRHGFPWIAKPAVGNGSRGVRVLLDEGQLQRTLGRPGVVLQPMIDPPRALAGGQPLKPDLDDGIPLFWSMPEDRLFGVRGWIDRDGGVHEGIGYGMTMVAGRYERMWRVGEASLQGLGRRYGDALSRHAGWRGPYHLQCKQDAGGAFIPIELHGRFGGGTAARRLLGWDEAGEVFRHWMDGAVEPDAAPEGAAKAVHLRYEDEAVPDAPARALMSCGRWPSA